MNVFVLSTGRCGSMTFARACAHITNFSAAHESRVAVLGAARLDYPPRHIESDNRLAWFLGRLEQKYGDNAYYVHLQRDRLAVARSYARRLDPGLIIPAYAKGIHLGLPEDIASYALDIALDFVDTVSANITTFLAHKSHKMAFQLETGKADFVRFWTWIGATGDMTMALAEFDVAHNASADSN